MLLQFVGVCLCFCGVVAAPLRSWHTDCSTSFELRRCDATSEEVAAFPEDMRKLLAWLRSEGAQLHDCLAVVPCAAGRCVVTRCAIAQGELIMSIPGAAALKPALSAEALPEDVSLADLALQVIAEMKLGNASRFATYLGTLPRILPEMLEDRAAASSCVRAAGESSAEQILHLKELVEHEVTRRERGDDRQTRLAVEWVFSRSQAPYVALIPLIDLMNAAIVPNAVPEVIKSTNSKFTSFIVRAKTSITNGEELTTLYDSGVSTFTGIRTLLVFGFVFKHNPWDTLLVDLGYDIEGRRIRLRLKYADQMDASAVTVALSYVRGALSNSTSRVMLELLSLQKVLRHFSNSVLQVEPRPHHDVACVDFRRSLLGLASAARTFAEFAIADLGFASIHADLNASREEQRLTNLLRQTWLTDVKSRFGDVT